MRKNTIQYVLVMICLFCGQYASVAQVVIGGTIPDSSAALEIQSSNMGFLLPRMSTFNRDAIRNPATGLMIFNTTTLCAEMNIGTPSLPEWLKMGCRTGGITGLDCAQITVSDTVFAGRPVNNVKITVPYTGGNGGAYGAYTVISTGITGLTASVEAGTFSSGNGSLVFSVTGIASAKGTALFPITIGEITCNYSLSVFSTNSGCGAYVAPGVWKEFMCYNLGVNNSNADPFTPNWEIHGGYWQWGRFQQAVSGPTGSDEANAYHGSILNWDTIYAPGDSWSDYFKTQNDPCPSGYRIPTKSQWEGVIANNPRSNIGTWAGGISDYSSGALFGTKLMLPLVGGRDARLGYLDGRGWYADYWSSTEDKLGSAWFLLLFSYTSTTSVSYGDNKRMGAGIRCIAEDSDTLTGSIDSIDCSSFSIGKVIKAGEPLAGFSANLIYSGANGGTYAAYSIRSTGINGLIASIPSGSLANGTGSIVMNITGTALTTGTASFVIRIAGKSCVVSVQVRPATCGAYVATGVWKEFMCYNLGSADTNADPFTPSWEINGGYWQWGRANEAAPGPIGSGAVDANVGNVIGWNASVAPQDAWLDGTKTANDPCPAGYRVPTSQEWYGVITKNAKSFTGNWIGNNLNYGSGISFGENLMLPAAGRFGDSGAFAGGRGDLGYYWTSTVTDATGALSIHFTSSDAAIYNFFRQFGYSIRCIADNSSTSTGSIDTLNCDSITMSGVLWSGLPAAGVVASVKYSGGNGGNYNAYTVSSTGVSGLTATLNAGSFTNGIGTLQFNISGTANSSGTANFTIQIAAATCVIQIPVQPVTCGAYIAPGVWKEFMCHNLGAANTSADPFIPSWEIIGGYWQWGRQEQAAAGPTGPSAGETMEGVISGWNTNLAPDGNWSDNSKTENDPCPASFRVPSKSEWEAMISNNIHFDIGSWVGGPLNYSSGKRVGIQLMLPASGYRFYDTGALDSRGYRGVYWSSTFGGSINAWYMDFSQGSPYMTNYYKIYGFSIRCIAE
jgi:uncharacterized protein (TIGR02145 family)